MPSNGGIVVIGNSCVDEYRYSKTNDVDWGSKIEASVKIEGGPFYGGAACNIVAALSAMGCENMIPMTAVGKDVRGRNISEYYKNIRGVNPAYIQKGDATAYSIVIVHSKTGRRNIVVLGRAPLKHFERKTIEKHGADWVVLASLGDLAQQAFDNIAERQDISVLAILGQNEIDKIEKEQLIIPSTLKNHPNAILVVNKEEFFSLQKKHAMLSMAFHEIVITDGPKEIRTNCDSDGNPILYSEKENSFHFDQWFSVPASEARVVDTSGAGDLFCAGYLYARRLGLDRPGAIKFASTISAAGIGHFGAHKGVVDMEPVLTREDVLHHIGRFYKPVKVPNVITA